MRYLRLNSLNVSVRVPYGNVQEDRGDDMVYARHGQLRLDSVIRMLDFQTFSNSKSPCWDCIIWEYGLWTCILFIVVQVLLTNRIVSGSSSKRPLEKNVRRRPARNRLGKLAPRTIWNIDMRVLLVQVTVQRTYIEIKREQPREVIRSRACGWGVAGLDGFGGESLGALDEQQGDAADAGPAGSHGGGEVVRKVAVGDPLLHPVHHKVLAARCARRCGLRARQPSRGDS